MIFLFEQDFMKRQINSISNALSVALFGKKRLSRIIEDDNIAEEGQGFDSDILKSMLDHSLSSGNFQEGRRLIFDAKKSKKNLILSLTFYESILKLNDEELEKGKLSRVIIERDIEDLKKIYAVREA
ncbi:MAG: DUF6483 family protein [Oscillospiraceae bacterium]|nr:DUF6483 family protein [Oscillospiraceae bacterium]